MRVKLSFPETVCFTTELAVRITDLNYGNHLGNDTVLRFVHEVRVQYLKSLGHTELDVGDGCSLIMADAAIMYRAEAFYGDVLKAEVAIGDISASSFETYVRLSSKQSGAEVARVKTGMVAFDYGTKSIGFLPTAFQQSLRSSSR